MISIVLPVYNEEKNIKKVIDDIIDFFYKKSMAFEIIAVNDGSFDDTAKVLNNYQRQHNVIVISHRKNLGYGAALRSGFAKAGGDMIFFTDSDGQFTIKDIEVFLEKIKKYDFVIGYRKYRKDSLMRIFYAFLFKLVARILFKIKVKDIDCAFKLFKKEIIKNMLLSENGALINLEILALARKRGYSFLELPVHHFERTSGVPTGGSFKVIFKAMYHIVILWHRMGQK